MSMPKKRKAQLPLISPERPPTRWFYDPAVYDRYQHTADRAVCMPFELAHEGYLDEVRVELHAADLRALGYGEELKVRDVLRRSPHITLNGERSSHLAILARYHKQNVSSVILTVQPAAFR